MDEFDEFRARAYSMNSAQLMRARFAENRRLCLERSDDNLSRSGTPFGTNFSEDVTLDQDDSDIYSNKPKQTISAANEITREFSRMRITRKDTIRSTTRSLSDESASDIAHSSRSELIHQHHTAKKLTEQIMPKSHEVSVECLPFSCLGQLASSSNVRRRSSSCNNRTTVHKNRDVDWNVTSIRPRTHSMPSQNKYSRYRKKLIAQRLHKNSTADSGISTRHGSCCDESDLEDFIRIRTFSISSKGITNKGDAFKRRRSNFSLRQLSDGIETNRASLQEFRGRSSSFASSETSTCSTSLSSPRYHRVVILGAQNVGKTSIVNQFMTSEYMGNKEISAADDTPRCVSVLLDEEEAILDIIDHTVREVYDADVYPSGDAYIVVFSVVDKESFDVAIEVLHELRKQQILQKTPLILVANKQDVVKQRAVEKEEGIKMALHYDVKYTEISTILNHKVDDLLVGTLKQIRLKEKYIKKMHRKGITAVAANDYMSMPLQGGCMQRGIFCGAVGKVLRQHPLFRSCDNLLVL